MTIGIYPGSFNPFHKGHYNILLKAEKIFDKVIIARGINTEKPPSEWKIPRIVSDRADVILYDGLLTDCVEDVIKQNKGVKVTVIRGLRNSVDLQYEMNQYRYFQDLMPNMQMVSIFCDKEFEHISSSGIRTLQPFGYDKYKNYLI
jgi:pantetheine-phosphate adenylyltransferase